jgi:hypothetical protein
MAASLQSPSLPPPELNDTQPEKAKVDTMVYTFMYGNVSIEENQEARFFLYYGRVY